MVRCFEWACLLLVVPSILAAAPIPRVLIIGIDGCRPDALQTAQTPSLDGLITDGAWFEGTDIREPDGTDEADTVSGPGWSNLLTGVWPDKHNVLDNKFSAPRYDRYPHMFARLKTARPQSVTASFSTWKPISEHIVSQADVNREFSDDTKEWARFDTDATEDCVHYLAEQSPDLLILYQGQVDEAGHRHGFHPRVPEYIQAIEQVDHNISRVLAAIRHRPVRDSEQWLVIVCTDHGGIGLRHGGGRNDHEVRSTFLIVSGPAAKQGKFDIPTYQVDVAATALTQLGVPLHPDWELDGHPVGLQQPQTAPSNR
ncbi:MAG: alkaline phosphatase family protein [Planctomycetaceae bacterium]